MSDSWSTCLSTDHIMQELITITTGGQGRPVVSARELHAFLEVRSKFSTWITQRIKDFDFVENKDYTTFTENLENGGRTIEYALTLSMAKELSMVERNVKGREARQYFIDKEEQLTQLLTAPAPLLTTEQMLLQLAQQQTQLLTNQQEQINQLREDIEQIRTTGHRPPARRIGKQLGVPGIPASRERTNSLRQTIDRRVSEYAVRWEESPNQTYNYLYKRLFDVYGVNVYRLLRQPNESLLGALERYGHLEKLYSLIEAELNYSEE